MLVRNRVGAGLTRSTISLMLPSLFSVKVKVNNFRVVVSPCGADRTSMASYWMENPTDKDGLLKRAYCFRCGIVALVFARATSLISRAAG